MKPACWQMVGVWCVWMWQELGRPGQLRLVELGPGRGTLMADLMRSTAAFPDFARAVSVDLIEVSLPASVGLLRNILYLFIARFSAPAGDPGYTSMLQAGPAAVSSFPADFADDGR